MRSIIRKLFLIVVFFAELAFASNEASAYFIYDYGKIFEIEHKSQNINLNAKILYQSPVSFNWNSTDIKNDGGKIVLFSASFPFNIDSFILEPSFLFGNGNWQKGDFQYFYGKPDLPYVLGFSMYFYHYSNTLGANYIFGNAKLLNNRENAELFDSDFYIYDVFYKFNINKDFNFYTGFARLNIEAIGALTAENQGYFLFPYAFYEASGYLDAKAIYGFANFKLRTEMAEYGFDLGALAIIGGKITGDMHYKYRKFFGTEEIIESLKPVQMGNNSFIFSIFSIKSKKIKIGKNYIQYGIQKPLAIPFGKLFYESQNIGNSDNIVKNAFFWGLTASVNFYF